MEPHMVLYLVHRNRKETVLLLFRVSVWDKDVYKRQVYIDHTLSVRLKVSKGAWRMPWLSEAMKDVISCDKLQMCIRDRCSGEMLRYHEELRLRRQLTGL